MAEPTEKRAGTDSMFIAVLLGVAVIIAAAAFLYSVHTRRQKLREAAKQLESLSTSDGHPGAVDDFARVLRTLNDYVEDLKDSRYAAELVELRQGAGGGASAHLPLDDPTVRRLRERALVVAIDKSGAYRLRIPGADPSPAIGPEALKALLIEAARKAPKDADGLPVLMVDVRPDGDAEYLAVQRAAVQCMRAYVEMVTLSLADESFIASSRVYVNGSGAADPTATPHIQVRLQCIDPKGPAISGAQPARPGQPAAEVSPPGDATRIEITVDGRSCGDLDALAEELAEAGRCHPGVPVHISGSHKTPYQSIFGAIRACDRAGIADIRLEVLPVSEDTDWWWK